MGFTERRNWSQQFIPELSKIVGPFLLRPTTYHHDAKEATDLIMLNARDLRIACRVRREGYADRYPHDFTIRASNDTQYPTELEKIIKGFGDWMIYAHEGTGGTLARWFIIDLDVFRAELIQDGYRDDRLLHRGAIPMENPDGSSFFAFDVRRLPPNGIIGSSHEIPFFSEQLITEDQWGDL